jgi:hypothetical protein
MEWFDGIFCYVGNGKLTVWTAILRGKLRRVNSVCNVAMAAVETEEPDPGAIL